MIYIERKKNIKEFYCIENKICIDIINKLFINYRIEFGYPFKTIRLEQTIINIYKHKDDILK